ncbi:MAG: hypothetical protein H7Y20_05250 [Bryobacteraceae bacterium]|nr:hypothetical protein [Bryobacteraceae bacterium]
MSCQLVSRQALSGSEANKITSTGIAAPGFRSDLHLQFPEIRHPIVRHAPGREVYAITAGTVRVGCISDIPDRLVEAVIALLASEMKDSKQLLQSLGDGLALRTPHFLRTALRTF